MSKENGQGKDQSPLEKRSTALNRILKTRINRVRAEFPLVPEDARSAVRLKGALAVLEKPLAGKGGLFWIAESIHAETEDLEDQLRTTLFTGAASELTSCALGYPAKLALDQFDEKDSDLWKQRYQTEEDFLFRLYEDRKEVEKKVYSNYKTSAILDLLRTNEFAVALKAKEREAYFDKIAHQRASENCGITTDDNSASEIVCKRFPIELEYLQGAVEANEQSHGFNDITLINTPAVQAKAG